jgi:microcompartment protein CcmL/EutN
MEPTIGVLEYVSIAKGIESTDAMLKKAKIELLVAKTVCSGKFLTIITGQVGAVEEATAVGQEVARSYCIETVVLPNIHPDIIPALTATTGIVLGEALGIIETYTVPSCIAAADIAVKSGDVRLLEIRPAVGLGGKSFVTLTGDVASVQSAIELGAQYPLSQGALLQKVVIPHPIKYIENIV